MDDAAFMRRALKLAARGIGNTSPNPLVGAVIARDGVELASGFHERAGAAHAEDVALRAAGENAKGATLYVSLEPCAHQGRTPPCADAIAASGVARVVIAVEDPDPNVRGRGIAQLRGVGIDVDVGVAAAPARELNRAYFHQRATGLPFVTLKMAQALNGTIGASKNARQQLTGAAAAKFVRTLRHEHDAVMVGVNTVVVDDPQLTVRPRKRRHVPYLRVVVDSAGRIPPVSAILSGQSKAQTIVATTERMPQSVRERLTKKRVEVMVCGAAADGRVDLNDLLHRLGSRGVLSVLCEGGPALAAALLRAGDVQRLHWLNVPRVIAGPEAVAVLGGAGEPLDLRFRIASVKQLGDDVLVTAALE